MIEIRAAQVEDRAGIWRILEPIIRQGEVYALPTDLSEDGLFALHSQAGTELFVADEGGELIGAAYLKPNRPGGGSHVANAGFATAPNAQGRGVARALCSYILDRARARGFAAMQFNFVVSTNTRAIALWRSFGFATVGVLPGAFQHPSLGNVDVFVMYRPLAPP